MSSKIRVTLVHNPTAGDERHSADELVAILTDAGFQVRYQSSRKGWKTALRDPADMIVAAGGDGTLAKVLKHASSGSTPVALLPLGTANNIGRTFRLLGEVEDVVRGWKTAAPRALDLGRVSWEGAETMFVEGCGGGVFALGVAEGKTKVEHSAEFAGHELDRALAFTGQVLERSQAARWEVTVDGRDVSGDYHAVDVLNVRFAGPSVPIAPDADPGDGLLDVVLIGEREREALSSYLEGRLHDAGAPAPELAVLRGRQVRLQPPGGPFRIDDEIVKGTDKDRVGRDGCSYDITVQAGAVQVLIADLGAA